MLEHSHNSLLKDRSEVLQRPRRPLHIAEAPVHVPFLLPSSTLLAPSSLSWSSICTLQPSLHYFFFRARGSLPVATHFGRVVAACSFLSGLHQSPEAGAAKVEGGISRDLTCTCLVDDIDMMNFVRSMYIVHMVTLYVCTCICYNIRHVRQSYG